MGVRFEKPPSAVQAALDRCVFALIRRKAAAKRPIGDTSAPGAERRLAARVEIGEAESLVVIVLPAGPGGTLASARSAEGPSLRLLDLSTTGCAFVGDQPVKPGDRIRLRLKGTEIDLQLAAKVIHVGSLGQSR